MPQARLSQQVNHIEDWQHRHPDRLLQQQDDEDDDEPSASLAGATPSADGDDENGAPAARELYRELVEQATDRQLSAAELDSMNAYEMAATVEFGVDAKQELLERRSESARLRLLAMLLRTALDRLALIDRAQTRAASNGKVRFG